MGHSANNSTIHQILKRNTHSIFIWILNQIYLILHSDLNFKTFHLIEPFIFQLFL